MRQVTVKSDACSTHDAVDADDGATGAGVAETNTGEAGATSPTDTY